MRIIKMILFLLFLAMFVLPFYGASAKTGNGIQLKNASYYGMDTWIQEMYAKKNGITYNIDYKNASILRRYGAKADTSELMTWDTISVWGTMNGTDITATKIKDLSIQKWNASFAGTITAIDDEHTYTDAHGQSFQQFTMQSLHRGSQTVRVYGSTHIRYKKRSMSFIDLAVGDKINAKGIWNSSYHLVYNTSLIKIKKLAAGD